MTRANLNEQHAEAAQLAVILQQNQRQKQKFRTISSAAATLQRAQRCCRGRKALKQRRFIRDSENLIEQRVNAANAIKVAWRGGKSRRVCAGLREAKTSARANRCARSIQCVT
jgi:hypothetical protein